MKKRESEVNMVDILNKHSEYRELLFKRGYLITTKRIINLEVYPFYSNWKEYNVNNYYIYINKYQEYHFNENGKIKMFMVGHSYNPFTMQYKEEELLEDAINAYEQGKEKFFDKISEFTGIHIIMVMDQNNEIIVQDCGGMKSCYFGRIESNIYITSHVQLVADICNLKMDSYVKRLVNTKCYNIGNRYLPGNISSHKEMKRMGPNTFLECKDNFEIKRFYPKCKNNEYRTEEEKRIGIEKIYKIMHNNVELATKKWKRPAISLSGGTDSKTTLAVANGFYDKFKFYSFVSKDSEKVDSEAAHKICKIINVKHDIYKIEEKNEEIKDFKVLKKIINHNTAYVMNISDHEIRKYIWLSKNMNIDIELKSWISEIGRVYLERRYGLEMPEVFNERHVNALQTRYFLHPILMRKADIMYKDFMKKTELNQNFENYEKSDFIYWEVRMGNWGTNVISSLDFGNNVTMSFNNRKLIQEFLAFPHEDRKRDGVHENVIKIGNNKIYNANIKIDNGYHNPIRILVEKTIYLLRTRFYKER